MRSIKELTKIANKLDSLGLTKEADVLDSYIRKTAGGSFGTFHHQFAPHDLPPEIEKLLKYLLTTSTAFNRYYDFRNQSIGIFIPGQNTEKAKALAAQITNISQYIRNELDKDGGENFLRWYINEIGPGYGDEIPKKLEELATKLDAESPLYKEASSHLRVTATFWRQSNSRSGRKSSSAPTVTPTSKDPLIGINEQDTYPKYQEPKSTLSGWDKYMAKTQYGPSVKKAWDRYTTSEAAKGLWNPSFGSFAKWYSDNMNLLWNGKNKSPQEVVSILNDLATSDILN